MIAIFRTDSSIAIGTGHVMRCLTLADSLSSDGFDCRFLCRDLTGNLIDLIFARGYQTYKLPSEMLNDESSSVSEELTPYSEWLGVSQLHDADQCLDILESLGVSWLIVDHYALDVVWETKVRSSVSKLMVIDDLATNRHDCDLLLDQSLARSKMDYLGKVPSSCKLLCGSDYALLRPEFSKWREVSLMRRSRGELSTIFINLGGVDTTNITCDILDCLQNSQLPGNCNIIVVMGSTAPWIELVRKKAAEMRWKTTVEVGVSNMAELMANSDLAFGAAGSTSWERCCLGLPTFLFVLARNQENIAKTLEEMGAAKVLQLEHLSEEISAISLLNSKEMLQTMSKVGAEISDGMGISRVIKIMKEF
ncbi:UDP-2,4-diacetamido-2,4,6-trideoxy-beta-L-altropyranose hydrolase [Gammaproteobacteria bacterium]|nr:UDP-2,4-diacetamido-2,4,6-trideoxy-beta-L-altropyranose hydrolase [Gammaproteobacteria bacterium]